jgi:N-acetylglucosamine kinase-like BadF-type ATPase
VSEGPVLGVHGDGDSCHALAVDPSGRILGSGASGPANWEAVGIEAAGAALRAAVREALERARLAPEDVVASVFGLAGVDFPSDRLRLRGVPEALGLTGPCEITNDSFAALRAGASSPWGVCVIAGRGAVAAGRNPSGEVYRTLGLGPLFGDAGSMAEVADDAVSAVADEFTGRGPKTLLTTLLCERTGSSSALELIEGLARGRIDSAGFAPVVFEAAGRGDPVARGILARAGEALGRSAALVVRALRMQDLEFELVLAGSVFEADPAFVRDALEETIRRTAPRCRSTLLGVPPVVGAALLAFELGQMPVEGIRERLGLAARELFRAA